MDKIHVPSSMSQECPGWSLSLLSISYQRQRQRHSNRQIFFTKQDPSLHLSHSLQLFWSTSHSHLYVSLSMLMCIYVTLKVWVCVCVCVSQTSFCEGTGTWAMKVTPPSSPVWSSWLSSSHCNTQTRMFEVIAADFIFVNISKTFMLFKYCKILIYTFGY